MNGMILLIEESNIGMVRAKGMHAVLFILSLSASIYNLWRERNNIRHGNHLQAEEKNNSEDKLRGKNEDRV
jgi:hypothetical protein